MEGILYKLFEDNWVETKRLTQRDVALIVDTDDKVLYIWEGDFSTSQVQSQARALLGKIKAQYINYKFRMYSSSIPQELGETLNEALQDSEEIKKKREIDYQSLERFQLVIEISEIIFFSVLMFGYLYSLALPIYTDSNLQQFYQFPTNTVQRLATISSYLVLLCAVGNMFIFCFSFMQKNYARIIYSIILIIGIFLLIIGFWTSELNLFLIYQENATVLITKSRYLFFIGYNTTFFIGFNILSILMLRRTKLK
jgi:hypothetical protein